MLLSKEELTRLRLESENNLKKAARFTGVFPGLPKDSWILALLDDIEELHKQVEALSPKETDDRSFFHECPAKEEVRTLRKLLKEQDNIVKEKNKSLEFYSEPLRWNWPFEEFTEDMGEMASRAFHLGRVYKLEGE